MRSLLTLSLAAGLTSAAPTAHAALVTYTFGGHVTKLPTPGNALPAPWTGIHVGDAMETTLTYNTASIGIADGAYTLHRGVVSAWSITIGSVTLGGMLPPVPSTSAFWVRDGSVDVMLANFITFPGPATQWGLGLTDNDGRAFDGGGALPEHMRFAEFDEVSMGLWRTPGGPNDSLQSTIEWCVPSPATLGILATGLLAGRRRH